MRTIIAGGRDFFDFPLLAYSIHKSLPWKITFVISGGAKGADNLGARWGKIKGLDCEVFKPDWTRYGRSAGPIRNAEMAENADALLAFWDGESKGTGNMIATARKAGLKVHVVRYGGSLGWKM